jgi:transposase
MKGIYILSAPSINRSNMRTPLVSEEEVVAFFKKHCVVTWEQLTSYFGISRQALQRKIKGHAHLKSLNHNRRFLVLKQFIGKTNQHGIWSYRGIVFSIHGNTPQTVTRLIHNSECGLSTKQLEQITSVKCWGILLKLLKEGKITRIKEGFDYIYFSSNPAVKWAQLENRGLTSQEPLVEAQTPIKLEKPTEIHNLLELGEEDYLLRRLEIVRRVKSGKSKAQVARELGCSPDTVRNTCKTFEKKGARGLVISRKKRPHKMTENMEKKTLVMKAKHPNWSPEKIGKNFRECGHDISGRSIRTFFEDNDLVDQKKTSRRS